jgi:hypothetical protein
MHRPERSDVLSLLQRLRSSPLGEQLILAGSSGLYGVSEEIPALTEDIDVLVDADWVAVHEPHLLLEMQRLGFEHQEGTSTFLRSDGLSLDLVGYSRRDAVDRIGGGQTVPVMVFSDLSKILSAAGSMIELPTQGRALSPAALAATKLLTVRLEKGSKDKLQALLLIEENAGDRTFQTDLRHLLGLFDPDRIDDALADAQAACLAVSGDVARADVQSGGICCDVAGDRPWAHVAGEASAAGGDMSDKPLTTAERWRRHQRDLEAYHRRSLVRRSHPRFRRDLRIVPHVFLLPSKAGMAPLQQSEETVRKALQGRAVWTLDTAARLVSGRGFLTSPDLTGYLPEVELERIVAEGLVDAPQRTALSVDPLYRRPPMLIFHLTEETPPHVELPSGDRVVPLDSLLRDLMGTLGWRPDLLTRLEATYPAGLPR